MKKPVPRCRKAIPGMPYMLFHGVEKPVPQCGKGSSAKPYGVFCGMKKRKPMIVRDLREVHKNRVFAAGRTVVRGNGGISGLRCIFIHPRKLVLV